MTRSITTYVPEERFFEAKARDARRFGESLAILDASDLSLIAGRGSLFRDSEASRSAAERSANPANRSRACEERPLGSEEGRRCHAERPRFLPAAAGIRPDDLRTFLDDPTEPFLVLAVPGGVAILFPQLLDATGLLPVLRFRTTPGNARKVREFAIRDAKSRIFDGISLAFGAETSTGVDGVEHILTACAEAQRLFSGSGQARFRLLLHLAANCAGCWLDHILLPSVYPGLTEKSRKTLTAFLLCAFLSARERDGEVTVAARASRERFSLSVEQTMLGSGASVASRYESLEPDPRAEYSAPESFSESHSESLFTPWGAFPEELAEQRFVPESFPVFAPEPVPQPDGRLLKLFPITSAACFRDCVELDQNGNLLFHAKLRHPGEDELHSWVAGGKEATLTIRLTEV